jgi:hypothetical protein
MARMKNVDRPLPRPPAEGMTKEQLIELAQGMERKEQLTAQAWHDFEGGETSDTDEYPDSGNDAMPPQVSPAKRTPKKKQKQFVPPRPAGKVAKRAQRRRHNRMDETQRLLFDTLSARTRDSEFSELVESDQRYALNVASTRV